MKKLGVRQVEKEGQTTFFFSDGDAPSGQILSVDGPVRLSFILRTSSPLFYNYTDFPQENIANQLLYFTNLSGASTFAPAREHYFPVNPLVFFLPTDADNITVEDELGDTVLDHQDTAIVAHSSPEGVGYQIDLTQMVPGCYSAMAEGQSLLDNIRLPTNFRQGDLALLSIYIGDTGDKGQYIVADGSATPEEYTIEFSARETFWRYHILRSERFENLQLLDATTDEVVVSAATPAVTRTLANGEEAILLTAPDPIPLHQRPGALFKLEMRTKDSSRTTPTSMVLPSANADRINRGDSAEDTKIYSDLYVYL